MRGFHAGQNKWACCLRCAAVRRSQAGHPLEVSERERWWRVCVVDRRAERWWLSREGGGGAEKGKGVLVQSGALRRGGAVRDVGCISEILTDG